MKRIHIARNRQPLGHFSPEEVATGLRSGRFLPSDLAWADPMESWKPLSEFTDLPVPESDLPPPIPPVAPLWSEGSAEPVLAQSVAPEPAWERREQIGTISALVETVKAVMSSPAEFFRKMKTEGGLRTPLIFFLIVATAAGFASVSYQWAIYKVNPVFFQEYLKQLGQEQAEVVFPLLFLITPISALLNVFILSGVFHLFLNLLGARGSFEATFRTYCYGAGSMMVFQFIPICGAFIFVVWGLAVLIIGFKEVHKLDYGRAVPGVLIPTLLCCGLYFGMQALNLAMSSAIK